ncbi:hypothetical protein POM88_052370 [Heracleum sosnowskyi]|uniref:ZN622/Rei1/Reh1 zinc finger C2H2-type domain-containing protein n=1 Tax=Heracleum sosnowskyi TaxID=360622 RepID=A0AAD8LWJ7_9APIA|nr:hypothetical protein POM88_052370 [Heracleum sosnowskyi]
MDDMDVNDEDSDGNEDDNMLVDVDQSCCFMRDLKHKTVERCMVHMHKQHGFFIADVEYLSDSTGLLTYLGLRIMSTWSIACYSCMFSEEESMADMDVNDEDSDGNEDGVSINDVELGHGGSELIITRKTDDKSREYLRYYRQKPRPSSENDIMISLALASR